MVNVNYDLIDKIMEAKKAFSLQRIIKYRGAEIAGVFGGYKAFSIIAGIPFEKTTDEAVRILLMMIGCFTLLEVIIRCICSDIYKSNAKEDLQQLIYDLNLNTNLELLMQSEVSLTERHPIKEFLPVLEKKYISVPTFDGGEVSVLQEHVLTHKEYTISLGEPDKKLELVKAKS